MEWVFDKSVFDFSFLVSQSFVLLYLFALDYPTSGFPLSDFPIPAYPLLDFPISGFPMTGAAAARKWCTRLPPFCPFHRVPAAL